MLIAIASLIAIALHFILNDAQLMVGLRFSDIPLLTLIIIGGIPLVVQVAIKMFRGSVGADFLGGIELVAAAALEQYLASALIALMLAGGQALEVYAMRKASAVLRALSERMPASAHRKRGDGVEEITLADIAIGDEILVYPHEALQVVGLFQLCCLHPRSVQQVWRKCAGQSASSRWLPPSLWHKRQARLAHAWGE